MPWRSWLLQILLLAFLGIFLLYPLAYVVPGLASDLAYQVRLVKLPNSAQDRAQVLQILVQINPTSGSLAQVWRLPQVVHTYFASRPAEALTQRLRTAGAEAEVVAQRQWTGFYFQQALGFQVERVSAFPYLRLAPYAPVLWESLANSLWLAIVTTVATTLLCLPLAYWTTHYRIRGQAFLSTLLLVPLLLPPFVGAVGLQHGFDRFGTLNLYLMRWGLLDPGAPIDWLGQGGFTGIVIMQVLHLYPILYLNLTAAWANIDPVLEEAARSLGASESRIFRTITFPLLLPGYFAGAALVFVWAFTDLGTPLVFQFNRVLPVQIFDQVSDPQRTNSVAYALVMITLLVTATLFYLARAWVKRQAYLGGSKGAVAAVLPRPGWKLGLVIYGAVLGVTLLAALPHLGVLLAAVSERWIFTPLPESYTLEHLRDVWANRASALSIRNSIAYSLASTLLDLILGVLLAWLIARRPSWLTGVLDGLATLPLALPGLVLAFGYLTCYSNWDLGKASLYLDPTRNPVALLIIAYTIRRMPYLTRSAAAGLQQIPPILEEAAENLGAGRWRVLRTITLPLLAANLVAGAILTFAFAALEVSDSLMLAREERFFPITRAIFGLLLRPDDGDALASALAVFAMMLLGLSLLAASLVLGRKMGQLFRA